MLFQNGSTYYSMDEELNKWLHVHLVAQVEKLVANLFLKMQILTTHSFAAATFIVSPNSDSFASLIFSQLSSLLSDFAATT